MRLCQGWTGTTLWAPHRLYRICAIWVDQSRRVQKYPNIGYSMPEIVTMDLGRYLLFGSLDPYRTPIIEVPRM